MIVTTQLVTKQHSPDTNIRKNTLQLLAKKNTLPYVNINEECNYITGNKYNYSTHLKTENLLQKLAKKTHYRNGLAPVGLTRVGSTRCNIRPEETFIIASQIYCNIVHTTTYNNYNTILQKCLNKVYNARRIRKTV